MQLNLTLHCVKISCKQTIETHNPWNKQNKPYTHTPREREFRTFCCDFCSFFKFNIIMMNMLMTSYKERERKRRNEYLTKHTIPGISGVIFMIKMFREKEFVSRVWIRNVLRGCLIGFSVHAALFVHSENRQMNNKRIACAHTLQSETRRKNKPKKNFKLARAYILILPLCGCWMFVWTQKKTVSSFALHGPRCLDENAQFNQRV